MGPLEGRVALITGASRGIGRAIALELARAGARVALNYRTGESEARSLQAQISSFRAGADNERVHGRVGQARSGSTAQTDVADSVAGEAMLLKADVASPDEARDLVRRVIEQWGRLDILVNNAGINRDRVLRKMTDEEWEVVIATNLNSAFYVSSAAVPAMIEQKYGRIVNISSVSGQSGNIGQANFAAAKAGRSAFTKSVAQEVARYNITVNAVCPGFTATDMLVSVPENILEQIRGKIPLGRFAEPVEVAKAVRFLVAEGDYITGQQLNVNGGIYM
jgi:NAD(P)-dependent dehydrogenase (short-subunit alcohol dehydrogenase family)